MTSVQCDELEISNINKPFAGGVKSNFIIFRLQKSNQEMALHSQINQQMPFQHIALKGKDSASQFKTKEIINKLITEGGESGSGEASSFQMGPSIIPEITPQNVSYN